MVICTWSLARDGDVKRGAENHVFHLQELLGPLCPYLPSFSSLLLPTLSLLPKAHYLFSKTPIGQPNLQSICCHSAGSTPVSSERPLLLTQPFPSQHPKGQPGSASGCWVLLFSSVLTYPLPRAGGKQGASGMAPALQESPPPAVPPQGAGWVPSVQATVQGLHDPAEVLGGVTHSLCRRALGHEGQSVGRLRWERAEAS